MRQRQPLGFLFDSLAGAFVFGVLRRLRLMTEQRLPSTPSASGSDPPSPPSVVLGISPDFSCRERPVGAEDRSRNRYCLTERTPTLVSDCRKQPGQHLREVREFLHRRKWRPTALRIHFPTLDAVKSVSRCLPLRARTNVRSRRSGTSC